MTALRTAQLWKKYPFSSFFCCCFVQASEPSWIANALPGDIGTELFKYLRYLSWQKVKQNKTKQNHLSRLMTKPTNWHVRPAKTQISLGIRPLWSVFAVHMKKAWILSYSLSTQGRHWSDWADAQADLSLRWARRIWVFAGRAVILLVLSWRGSFFFKFQMERCQKGCFAQSLTQKGHCF